ncbi:MAG: RMD1 family protein [Cytophagales bacterium]
MSPLKIEAFQLAEQINIRKFRKEFKVEATIASVYELFYVLEEGKFLNIFNYGIVVLGGYNVLEKSSILKFLSEFLEKIIDKEYNDDFIVEEKLGEKLTFKHNSISVPELNEKVVRICMLHVGQSVAMDYYESVSYDILEGTKQLTEQLEKYGKIKIPKKDLLRFIGRTLNIKNSILDNLYILDNPESVWDDEYLSKVDGGLKDIFEISIRFRDVDYRLKIVENNMKLFTDLLQHRESSFLEWIIIVLIFIEIINIFIEKVF